MKAKDGQTFVDTLRNAGFRATKTRLSILSCLHQAQYPLSIKEIVAKVGRKHIDQVTVYRTLESFKKAGIVVQVELQHGRSYYELKDVEHDHHHLVCTKCEKIEDFTGCDYDELAATALRQAKEFATVTNHSLELFGLCKACAKRL